MGRAASHRLHLHPMRLLRDSRPIAYTIIFGIWAEVFLYCLLHDQYLVRIAPEHFTVWHPPLWGIRNEPLLAAAWAFRASIGPGLGLGLMSLFAARAGSWPRIDPPPLLKRVALGILVTELCGATAGWHAWTTGQMIFPEIIYPDLSRPLITTQTIQLTCYAVGALVSLAFLTWILLKRHSLSRPR